MDNPASKSWERLGGTTTGVSVWTVQSAPLTLTNNVRQLNAHCPLYEPNQVFMTQSPTRGIHESDFGANPAVSRRINQRVIATRPTATTNTLDACPR
jgi:hypothetical protein